MLQEGNMQDYKTIRSVEEIDAYLGNATVVAFDFETAATDEYTNGPSGNQVGWKQKKEVTAWQ